MKTSFYVIILLAILSSFSSCQETDDNTLIARLTKVSDNIMYADSTKSQDSWGRSLIMTYTVINKSNRDYYLPLNEYYGHKSQIKLNMLDTKKISPSCHIEYESIRSKHRVDSCIISANDTSIILFCVQDIFKSSECEYSKIPTKEIMSGLNITYELDSTDLYKGCPMPPSIIFANDTNNIEIDYKLDFQLKKSEEPES